MAAGVAAATFVAGIRAPNTWLTAFGVLTAVTSVAAIQGRRWAPAVTMTVGIGFLLAVAWWIHQRGFTWKRATGIGGGVACIGWALFQAFRRRKRRQARRRRPLSLVLLLRTWRFLDDRLLASIASAAWGDDFPSDSNGDQAVVCEGRRFVLRGANGRFVVQTVPHPYWEECDSVAEDVTDVRAQRVIREHQAWISIEYPDVGSSAARERAWAQMARFLTELAGPETLAIIQPESGAFRLWDDRTIESLRSDSPLSCFSNPAAAPVVQISPDDPLMAAAVAEARRRWPEFASAFIRRHPEQYFSVKAPVTRAGQTEHIWIEVTGITGEHVRGKLGNDPVDLCGLKLGDPISVPIGSIEDWLYVLTDEPIGGFTIPAATTAPKRAKQV